MKDEPDWIVDQMLKRKHNELFQRWQDREERLAKIRAKEGELEARGKKRRRIEEARSRKGKKEVDEDAEFMLIDWEDDVAADDPLSVYSKETRALMEGMGLLPGKKQEEETVEEDEIKVCIKCCATLKLQLTLPDILHIENPLPALTVHPRTSTPVLPLLCTFDTVHSSRSSLRNSPPRTPLLTPASLHQPICIPSRLSLSNQRPLHRTTAVKVKGEMLLYS